MIGQYKKNLKNFKNNYWIINKKKIKYIYKTTKNI